MKFKHVGINTQFFFINKFLAVWRSPSLYKHLTMEFVTSLFQFIKSLLSVLFYPSLVFSVLQNSVSESLHNSIFCICLARQARRHAMDLPEFFNQKSPPPISPPQIYQTGVHLILKITFPISHSGMKMYALYFIFSSTPDSAPFDHTDNPVFSVYGMANARLFSIILRA